MENTDHTEIIRPVKQRWTFDSGGLAVIVSNTGDLQQLVKSAELQVDSGRNFIMSKLYTDDFSVIAGPVLGAPYTVIILENFISWGLKEFIYVGWCGSLSPQVSIGDIVIPSAALIDEGTSVHYHGKSGDLVYPDPALTDKLEQAFIEQGVNCRRGMVWTTDAIFRETRDKIAFMRSKGAAVVEMELSALITAGKYRGVAVGAVLVVSDDISGKVWNPGFNDPRFIDSRKKIAEIVAGFKASHWAKLAETNQTG